MKDDQSERAGDLTQQSSAPSPATPKSKLSEENTDNLCQEVHWVHRATFWSQVGLGVIGIAALIIYGCQLGVMRGTLSEMKTSGETSTQQMWSAINNLNWMARSVDWSQKTTQKAKHDDTHNLLVRHKPQSSDKIGS